MITLSMERECGCFRKSAYESVQSFKDINKAEDTAKNMCLDMNKTFCQKHKFIYQINDNEIKIKIKIKMAVNK